MYRGKSLSVLLIFFMFLAGCTAEHPPSYLSQEQLSPEFSCRVRLNSNSSEKDVFISHTAENSFSCEGKAICYYWNGGQFYEKYAGLETSKDSCTLPATSYALQLKEFLSVIFEGDMEPIDSKTLKGAYKQTSFIVIAEGKSGRIQEIHCEKLDFHASFYQFKEMYG